MARGELLSAVRFDGQASRGHRLRLWGGGGGRIKGEGHALKSMWLNPPPPPEKNKIVLLWFCWREEYSIVGKITGGGGII